MPKEDTQWKPGQSGNPKGRPKGSFSLVTLLKKKLEQMPGGKNKTYAEYFIDRVLNKAIKDGDVSMMRDVLNRVDGMPKQNHEVGGVGGKDITFKVVRG